jgi:hypothetical protein
MSMCALLLYMQFTYFVLYMQMNNCFCLVINYYLWKINIIYVKKKILENKEVMCNCWEFVLLIYQIVSWFNISCFLALNVCISELLIQVCDVHTKKIIVFSNIKSKPSLKCFWPFMTVMNEKNYKKNQGV